jgi:hypothetical protein
MHLFRSWAGWVTATTLVGGGVVANVSGCGGSSASPAGMDAGTDSAVQGDGASGAVDSPSAEDASGSSGGEDASGSSSGGSSSSGTSSGASSSSSGGVASSGAGMSPGDGGPNQIACGMNAPCDSLTQVCCATTKGRSCTTAAMCTGDSLACSGTNSCVMGVCCEGLTAAGAIKTTCRAACPAGSRQLCTTTADCADKEVCRHGADGYGICEADLVADAGRD